MNPIKTCSVPVKAAMAAGSVLVEVNLADVPL